MTSIDKSDPYRYLCETFFSRRFSSAYYPGEHAPAGALHLQTEFYGYRRSERIWRNPKFQRFYDVDWWIDDWMKSGDDFTEYQMCTLLTPHERDHVRWSRRHRRV